MEKPDLEHSSSSSHSPTNEKVLEKDGIAGQPGDVTGDGFPPDPDDGLSPEERSKIVCLNDPKGLALLTRIGSQASLEARPLPDPMALLALPHQVRHSR